ncbi:aldehyde dehydrogenase (NADP(+)) [Opitutus terrae]|uniref:2,5-dioxovalerate dehydrogenase n=1 Tax=Opitutus terrae (strain DSM 11246 / JCM 15787 / PB90-1) TaxID=452637 RepID=B1ZUY1_OPITP|nr:aldehyde dehydrogenase (NADP(+)) [Opitutus terrae]ACB75951.1 Aldehyde Dehydrogenase [Opitutus terrae PB90-1]
MILHGKSLIAGQPGQAGGPIFWTVNPATGHRLTPDFHSASAAEVDRALHESAAAFADYSTRPPAERAAFLDAIATAIEAVGDELLQRAHQETGLPLARITGERARTCGQLRLFANLVREGSWVDARIDPALPQRQPLPRPDLRRMLTPLGPVVVFGSSNFPLAFSVAGGDTASAFAAGCTVVVKAHRAHAGTAELVGGAITQAAVACGLPPGVFSMIHGEGATAGVAMVKHPATAAVGFTGSRTAGRALFDAAAARPHPIPVFAEMSSLNPVFLLPRAVHERGTEIAQGLLSSFTLGVGQFCTKPGLVFALRSPETDAFIEKFGELVREAPCGVMLTSGIREAFLKNRTKVTSVVGVLPLIESSKTADPSHTESQPSFAVSRGRRFLEHPELATEAFGPFTLIVIAETEDELKACAASLEGQLTATVHGTPADLEHARPLLATLEQKAGRLLINSFPTGVEVSPAMNHGGPYPATTDVRFTSVGTAAIYRFARPVCYQGFPDALLPLALQDANPLGLLRLVDGKHTRDAVQRV